MAKEKVAAKAKAKAKAAPAPPAAKTDGAILGGIVARAKPAPDYEILKQLAGEA